MAAQKATPAKKAAPAAADPPVDDPAAADVDEDQADEELAPGQLVTLGVACRRPDPKNPRRELVDHITDPETLRELEQPVVYAIVVETNPTRLLVLGQAIDHELPVNVVG